MLHSTRPSGSAEGVAESFVESLFPLVVCRMACRSPTHFEQAEVIRCSDVARSVVCFLVAVAESKTCLIGVGVDSFLLVKHLIGQNGG